MKSSERKIGREIRGNGRSLDNPFVNPTKDTREEIDKVLKDRKKEYKSVSSLDVDRRHKGKCCCCCHNDPIDKKEEQAILVWHRKYCKTFEDFKMHMESTTKVYMNSVASLRAVISNLTYWDDPTPGIGGLSIIGGHAWLITSALHYFFDDDSDYYRQHFEYIKVQYQNLAAAAEMFLENADEYFQHVHRMRNDGQVIVKKLVEKWRLQESDPLIAHPMVKQRRRRPRRHVGNGLDFEQDLADDEQFFHVQLARNKIVCCHKDSSEWIPFAELYPQDKVDICQIFLQSAEDLVENTTEDIRKITGKMSTIETKGSAVVSQAREITGAMRHFAKTYKRKEALEAEEQKRILHLVEEFWLALDRLHDDSYELLRLAQETRDIIRTCYIYLDVFYKCDMPDYDNFLLCVKNRKGKQDRRASIKHFWDKFVTYNHENQKVTEVLKFLSLSDFTMSIYQLVVAKHAVQADGISLKIGSYEEPTEPWGLVGTDVRKKPHNGRNSTKASKTKGTKRISDKIT